MANGKNGQRKTLAGEGQGKNSEQLNMANDKS